MAANEHNTKMLQQAYRTAYLIAGHLKSKLSTAEQEELDDWITESDDNMRLFGDLTKEENVAASLASYEKMKVEEDLKLTKERIKFKPRSSSKLLRIAIAASVLISAGLLFYFNSFKQNNQPIAVQVPDIKPGSDQATLTLPNGSVIGLSSANKDSSINGGALLKLGEIIYTGKNGGDELVYHTLTVPRKGKYKVILADGTKVWLNAESSMRFPTAFLDTERKVFITGEAFFEVAKDKDKPFRVVANDMTVEALGTQFNVKVYDDEPYQSATLVEGAVLVTRGKEENILQPGQQAQVNAEGFKVLKVNVPEVTGWKDDQFVFVNSPLESILRQVARWYDAEIVYEDKIDVHLNATIDRSVPVSKLLAILEATGHVHFSLEDKVIKVKR